MARTPDQQANPRKNAIIAAVTDEERELVEQARQRAGVGTMSVFVRETMLERAAALLAPKRRGDTRRDSAVA